MKTRPILGFTMGDPAGVGPELCLRALNEPAVLEACMPVLFGDANVAQRLTEGGFSFPKPHVISLEQWRQDSTVEMPLMVDCAVLDARSLRIGEVAADCGRAAYRYIEQAIGAAMACRIDGIVTAPINKEALRLAGVPHPGHTEIFTALTNAARSCMMLRSDVLTVSLITTHVGYSEVPQNLSVRRVLDVIELTAEAMHWMLGRPACLGICGLNPHAGEHGLFGRQEEEHFVQPAINLAREQNIAIEGPLPPDAAFTPAQRKRFDAIITLYHDQGHIPFKMLAFDTGVNITLGLPIVRTSVDHGTAFDIAWKGLANPQSLFAAVQAAVELVLGKRVRRVAA